MNEAVIVSTARTGVGKAYRGALNNTEGPTMAGHVIAEAVKRARIEPGEVEDVVMGCAMQQGTMVMNVARKGAIRAGLPVTVLPGMLLAFGVGAVAGNYASGQLADRLGPTRVVVLALLLSSTICIALTLILQLPSAYAGPLLIGRASCRERVYHPV